MKRWFPKLELVADWRQIIRFPSMWLAVVASAVVAFILTNPMVIFAVIAFFPPHRQLPLAITAALFILLLIASTRLIRFVQNREGEDPHEDGSGQENANGR